MGVSVMGFSAFHSHPSPPPSEGEGNFTYSYQLIEGK